MVQFELRFFDRQKVLVLSRYLYAQNDAGAMAEARSASLTHSLELWQDTRLVGRIEKPLFTRSVPR